MSVDIKVQIWDRDEVARWVRRLAQASAVADSTTRRSALEIAWGLHHAGETLVYTDEDDADVVFELLTRLDGLRTEAEAILELLEAATSDETAVTKILPRPRGASSDATQGELG